MSCSSKQIIIWTFAFLFIVILPSALRSQGTAGIDTLSNLTIEDTRSLFRGILDMRRLSHSVAVGRIAKDQRLATYVEGFMERNNVDVFTIAFIDSDRFWPNVFKNWSLKKLAQQPQEKLLTARARFIPNTSGGKVVGYKVDLELEGRSNQLFELLQIENTTLEAIAGAVNANQLNSDFSDPVSVRETVVDALVNSLQKIEEHGEVSLAVEGNEQIESSDSIDNDPATSLIHTDSVVADNVIVTGLTRNPYLVAINTISDSVNVGQQRIQMTYTIADTLGLENVKLEVVQISDNDTIDVVAYFDLPKGQKIDFIDSDGKIGWSGLDANGKPIGTGKYQFKLIAATDKNFENGFEDYETAETLGCSSAFCCTECGKDLTIDQNKLTAIFPNSRLASGNDGPQYAALFNTALQTTSFNTCDRQAKLFAQIKHESAGFNSTVEGQDQFGNEIEWSLNWLLTYFKRTSGAKRHWFNQDFWDDGRYKEFITVNYYAEAVGDGTHKKGGTKDYFGIWNGTNQTQYHVEIPTDFKSEEKGDYKTYIVPVALKDHNRKNIFRYAYGGVLGNEDPSDNLHTEDGWNFMGKGAIQLTGRDNYKTNQEVIREWFKISYDLVRNPDLVSDNAKVVVYSSVTYIMQNVSNIEDIDAMTIDQFSALVNTGNPGNPISNVNGGLDRKNNYEFLIVDDNLFRCDKD